MPESSCGDISGSPLVTVILCVYNGEDYLSETIQAVFNQTYRSLELIVVDDGSTDQSVSVIQRLSATDSRLRLIRKANGGTASALAAGLALAQGDFVAFLDQDDLWTPDKLAAHVEWMRHRPHSDLTFSWFQYIDSHGRSLGIQSRRFRGGLDFRGLLAEYAIGATSNVVVRTHAVLRAGGIDTSIPRLYDLDLFLRIARLAASAGQPNLECLPRDLMAYRRHSTQITRDFTSLEQEWELVIDKMRHLAPDDVAAVEYRGRSHNCRFLARLAYERYSYRQALSYVCKGFRSAPLTFLTDRRNWLTAAACLSGAVLPAPVHRMLESVAGLKRTGKA